MTPPKSGKRGFLSRTMRRPTGVAAAAAATLLSTLVLAAVLSTPSADAPSRGLALQHWVRRNLKASLEARWAAYRARYLDELRVGKRKIDKRFLDAWSNLGESVEAVDGLYKPSTRSRSSEGTGFDPEKVWGDDGD